MASTEALRCTTPASSRHWIETRDGCGGSFEYGWTHHRFKCSSVSKHTSGSSPGAVALAACTESVVLSVRPRSSSSMMQTHTTVSTEDCKSNGKNQCGHQFQHISSRRVFLGRSRSREIHHRFNCFVSSSLLGFEDSTDTPSFQMFSLNPDDR